MLYIRKSVEPILSLVPRVEALASPNLSKRATPKAPRQCKYIISPSIPTNVKYIRRQRGRYTIHPIERSRCFVFDKLCRELPDSYTSKPKRTKTPFTICMSVQPLPIGASGMGIDVTKITLLSRKPLRFAGKV